MIKEGWIQASAAQQSAYMTNLCFTILYLHKHGILYPSSLPWERYGVRPVPEIIKVPIALVTKENVNAFYRK